MLCAMAERMVFLGRFRDMLEKSKDSIVPEIQSHISLIEAMTPEDRANPDRLMQGSFKEKQKIAQQTGQTIQDVNRLVGRRLLFTNVF